MRLKVQLLLFGLLTLALPWAGFRFIAEMEGALRQGFEASLVASASTAATALANDDGVLWPETDPDESVIYAHTLASAPRIDGYGGDWRLARSQSAPDERSAIELGPDVLAWLGVYGRYAYVLVAHAGDQIVRPAAPGSAPFGDRVALLTGSEPVATLLSTSAPGQFRAVRTRVGRFEPLTNYEDRVLAAWQEPGSGFAVEVRLPLALLGEAFGIVVIDVDPVAGDDFHVEPFASWGSMEPKAAPIVAESGSIVSRLSRLGRAGDRYRVIDRAGWVLADSGTLEPLRAATGETASAPLSEQLLRTLLRRNDPQYDGLESPVGRVADASVLAAMTGDPVTTWYRRGPESEAVIAAAVPIVVDESVVGALVLEQASDSVLALSNQARVRLMLSTLVISLVAALALFGYASWLSLRIRRLAAAAETAMAPTGEVRADLPGSLAGDEIGDLSRSYSHLLGRLAAYTDYLRTLSGKLAHEIRTPIAIISTSLENLSEPGDDAQLYQQRARQGTARLEAILNSMSAATRVEQAIGETAVAVFDLGEVVRSCAAAYQDIYTDRGFSVSVPEQRLPVEGSAELLAQLLDKLIENAVGFSETGSLIDINLRQRDELFQLDVSNPGPTLPEGMRHQLFDSLVSVRERGAEGTHLGLGLYIVALVVRFHRGVVRARNLPDGSGVVIAVELPRADTGA